jgi:hypothetical protein
MDQDDFYFSRARAMLPHAFEKKAVFVGSL